MKRYERYVKSTINGRIRALMLISSLAFLVLLYRLYDLQIRNNEDLKLQALKQRSVEINLNGTRGTIFDRNLQALTNREARRYIIGPRESIVRDEHILNQIIQASSLSPKEIFALVNSEKDLLEIPLIRDIELEEDSDLSQVNMVNRYRQSNLLAHVIGYINKAENKGEYGIERVYDEFLNKNERDSIFYEYDKRRDRVLGISHYVHGDLGSEEPAGVQLTIDERIQGLVEKIMDESMEKGALIIGDMDSGEILAMASRPNFNQDKKEKYFQREDMALYNKAIQVSYPPGSLFKIVVLLAGLEEDPSYINRDFYCKGYDQLGSLTIKCNNPNGHGRISLKEGFAKSCNSVFIQLGQEIGAKNIMVMAENLGLGQKVNIGLLEEVEGSLPRNEGLLGPAIGHISIGQDKIEATPLQITRLLLILGNNGIKKDITIVKGITTKTGRMIKEYSKEEDQRIIDQDKAEIVREYLEEVIRTGTGRNLDLEEIGGAAGKTGTAEAILNGRPTIHGWFSGYYPRERPKYAITILVEDTILGSTSTIPIFEKICKELYKISP